jgi:hypothetical protein
VTPDVSGWIRDWTVANYADDFATGAQPVDTYSSWNLRSMVSAVNQGNWPLATPVLDTSTVTSVSITDGSAAYLRFGVPANAIGGGRITNRGAVVPAGFALSILRTK